MYIYLLHVQYIQYYGKVQYNKLLQWSRNRGGKGGPRPPKLNKGGPAPPISIILSCNECHITNYIIIMKQLNAPH